LKGLNYLHQHGFIHRNIKSENVLIDEETGEVKLCDFALSKVRTIPDVDYTPEDPNERERSPRETKRL